MDNRQGQAAKAGLKVQILGSVPALNGSKSLGECRPGILIQHFVRHRGQTQLWTCFERLFLFGLGLCPSPGMSLPNSQCSSLELHPGLLTPWSLMFWGGCP